MVELIIIQHRVEQVKALLTSAKYAVETSWFYYSWHVSKHYCRTIISCHGNAVPSPPQQDNVSCQTIKSFQEWLEEQRAQSFWPGLGLRAQPSKKFQPSNRCSHSQREEGAELFRKMTKLKYINRFNHIIGEETVSLINEDISYYTLMFIVHHSIWKNTLNLSLIGTFAQISHIIFFLFQMLTYSP